MDAFLRGIMEDNFCLLWDKMEITRFMSLLMPLWMWRIKITENGFWNYYIKILKIISIMDGTSSHTCKSFRTDVIGLIPVMQEVMSGVPHRYCAMHLWMNFTKQWKDNELRGVVWECARSVAPRRYGLRGPIPSADRPKNTSMRGPTAAHPTPAYVTFLNHLQPLFITIKFAA
ncbi:hypothetical protein MTR_7g090080 [Medicago truncatula]|uniref:MULE transposase domain-containing protein n=1 Tax=Medicago truncatula TaxID=3880 RepID=G7KRL7_MEDTR|nr:hypothetical protein MTR_7g090080 [Medicago truncatula]